MFSLLTDALQGKPGKKIFEEKQDAVLTIFNYQNSILFYSVTMMVITSILCFLFPLDLHSDDWSMIALYTSIITAIQLVSTFFSIGSDSRSANMVLSNDRVYVSFIHKGIVLYLMFTFSPYVFAIMYNAIHDISINYISLLTYSSGMGFIMFVISLVLGLFLMGYMD